MAQPPLAGIIIETNGRYQIYDDQAQVLDEFRDSKVPCLGRERGAVTVA